jgi:uncharacterized protein
MTKPSLSRRDFVKALEVSLGAASVAPPRASAAPSSVPSAARSAALPPGRGITNNLLSPHIKLKSIDVDSAQWTSGLWAERFDTCAHVTVQHLWQEMEGVHYANFLRAVGDVPIDKFQGAGFSDGDFYKWLEAAIASYGVTRDAQLEALIDRVITMIGRAQRPDGYIFTRLTLEQRSGRPGAKPFENALDFETYNCGHLMTAACLHYKVTGQHTFLDIAIRLSDYLCGTFANPTPELARFDICPSHYMGIIEMYRTTGDTRYRDLGKKFIDMRDLVENGSDQNQEREPFRQQNKAVGHAVRANYLYAGAADVYAETGDETLLSTLYAIWDDVASHKLYITGATGALNTGTSPSTYGQAVAQELSAKGDTKLTGARKESARDAVDVVSQAYGREYQLPNLTSYNESCATVGSVLWQWRMFQITGQSKFADLLETTLLNGVFSAVSLDGTRFFYSNALRRSHGLPFPMRYPPRRQEYFRSYCCPPNIARTVAESSCYSYCLSDQGVWTVLYGASKWNGSLLDGTELVLTQTTGYPWNGDISIAVNLETPAEFSLMLRIPAWARGASAVVHSSGGRQFDYADLPFGQYFEVRRKWSSGDRVDLTLPMSVRLIEGHKLVEETRGQIAVLRGPVVYCLEIPEAGQGTDLADFAIPRSAQFRPVHHTIGEVRFTALEGEILKHETRPWGNTLYREISTAEPQRVTVRMIPYLYWDNRGMSEMSIWFPTA